jgi:hypothetical protein
MLDVSEPVDMVSVWYIHDPQMGSPPELAHLGNTSVPVPAAAIPLKARGKLYGHRGYSRQRSVETPPASGTFEMRWEWVLMGDVDPIDQFVDSLTGRPGWILPEARATVKLMIERMFSAGIPRATIRNQVPPFFAAVQAETRAEDAASPPTP